MSKSEKSHTDIYQREAITLICNYAIHAQTPSNIQPNYQEYARRVLSSILLPTRYPPER